MVDEEPSDAASTNNEALHVRLAATADSSLAATSVEQVTTGALPPVDASSPRLDGPPEALASAAREAGDVT